MSRWTFNLTQDTPIKFWAQHASLLSKGEFAISNIELLDYYPTYEENYATVISEQYNEQGYLTEMVVKFPEGINWADTTPRLSGAYMNGLYNNGVTALTISTTVESGDYLFATIYNGVAGYDASRRISLVENGGDLQFAYVRQGGLTAEREVSISFAYEGKTSEEIASEIGATLNGSTTISKNGNGSYDVYDTRGMGSCLEFSASQVNAWLDQGWGLISFSLTFTAVAGVIDETVVYGQSATMSSVGAIEDYSGAIDLALILNRDQSIYIWTQVNHEVQPYATFTISNIVLSQSQESIAEEIGITLKNGSQIAKDGNGGYVLSNVGYGYGGMMSAYFSAEQVNEWISQGYATLSVDISFTASDTIDQVVGLNGVSLGEGNFVELFTSGTEWTFTLTADTPIQFWAQKSGGANSGAFTLSDIALYHYSFTSGYSTVIEQTIDENGRLTSLTISIPEGLNWWQDTTPKLNQDYLNSLYASGVRTVVITASANPDTNNLVVNYNKVETYVSATQREIVENGGDLRFSYVNLNTGGTTVATTLTLTFSYS